MLCTLQRYKIKTKLFRYINRMMVLRVNKMSSAIRVVLILILLV